MSYRDAPIHLKPFLVATGFCDSEHPAIVEVAREICPDCGAPADVARAVRHWMRTRIEYVLDYCNVKASETLAKREGMCTNKATLQVALMRALGLPAGYGLVRISRQAFSGVLPELFDRISDPTTHVFACAWIAEEARFCFFDSTERARPEAELELIRILPTGETRYQDRWLRGEIHVHSNLDHLFALPSRWPQELFERQNALYRKHHNV